MVRMGNAVALGRDEVAEEDVTGAQEEGLSDADSDEEGSTADDDLARRPAGRLIVNSLPQVVRARPAPQEEPLSRIADNATFETRCSNLACHKRGNSSGLTDCLCECGLIFCQPCDSRHSMTCPSAPRLDESHGPLAVRCGALGCTHPPRSPSLHVTAPQPQYGAAITEGTHDGLPSMGMR